MNNIECAMGKSKGYCIRLANGQGWRITATEEVISWMGKLIRIMELKECDLDGYPRLVFIHKENVEERNREPFCDLHPGLRDGLPPTGWKSQDFVWLQIWTHPEIPDVICEIKPQRGHEEEVLTMRMALQPIYQRSQDSGGLPFHAALLEWNGFGFILAASGSTGKSTCCRRLRDPWRALCDDEALVVRDNREGYLVHPFPTWSDYFLNRSRQTWNIQSYLPLSAIFFLEQAETDQLVPMGQGQAAALVYASARQVCARNWMILSREQLIIVRKRLFENACDLAKEIPAYKLKVSLKGNFWEEMEKAVRKAAD
jgi:SynChlorMet cassette protein ScmC